MFKLSVFSFVFLLFLQRSVACRCVPQTLRSAYNSPDTEFVFRAKVIATFSPCTTDCGTRPVIREDRYFVLRVFQVFKGCLKRKIFLVRSRTSSSECAINLRQISYLFNIRSGFVPYVSSCDVSWFTSFATYHDSHHVSQFIRPWRSISSTDRHWLETRVICCGRDCKCGNGKPLVNCFVSPCEFAKPECDRQVKCVDNFCGGCNSVWFDAEGRLAVCPAT